jgi:hypothetical protein
MKPRAWLRVVLYRTTVQLGWLWLAAVAWFAVIMLPDGRWNRTFDGRAIATITSIHVEVGAEDPEMLVEYVFRVNGREYTNHGYDDDRPRDLVEGREVDVAYASSDPRFSELLVPGIRTRYGPLARDLMLLGVVALGAVLAIIFDTVRARREARRPGESRASAISERKRPAIWFLFVIPLAALAGFATLAILFYR